MKLTQKWGISIAVIVIALLFGSLLSSCKNDDTVTNGSNDLRNIIVPVAQFQNIGVWHNQGVAQILQGWDKNAQYAQTTRPAMDTIIARSIRFTRTVPYFEANYQGNPSAIDTFVVFNNIGLVSRFTNWWNSFKVSSIATSNIPNLELQLVDSAATYLMSVSSNPLTSALCDSIISRANALLITFNNNNSNWSTDTTGDFASGTLYVMKASAEYIKSTLKTKSKKDILSIHMKTLATAAHADAVGYIVGWSMELYHQIQNGTFTRENQGKRIQAGFDMAIEWTCGALFGLWKP